MKNFFSFSVCASQKYGFWMVTMKPVSPADCFWTGSADGPEKDWMRDKSSRFHVFPIEKVPFAFSLDLCMRTRPDFRTATMMIRSFSV